MDYIEKAFRAIRVWENRPPRLLERLLHPAERVASKLIPAAVSKHSGKGIEAALSLLADQTLRTVGQERIALSVQKEIDRITHGELASPAEELRAADAVARRIRRRHGLTALGEGGASGFFGLPGLAVDIPALFGILLRQIQSIACCYGYDPSRNFEREYLLQVLQAGTTGSMKEKVGLVLSLKEIEQILVQLAAKRISHELAAKELGKHALVATVAQIARRLGFELTERKTLQWVPVAGAVIGAGFNTLLTHDIGTAACMSYRRRWITDRTQPPPLPPPPLPRGD